MPTSVLRTVVLAFVVCSLVFPAGVVGATETTDDTISQVAVTPLYDRDGDGAAASFQITIVADTSFDDTDTWGHNPGEPYLEIEIDGEDYYRSSQVTRSESYRVEVTLSEDELSELSEGEHELTVELWDRDGDEFDSTDVANDDRMDDWSTTIRYEKPTRLELETSRTKTTLGSPISVRVSGSHSGAVNWSLVNRPDGSDAELRPHPSEHVVTLRPEKAGQFTIRAQSASPTGNQSDRVTVDVENQSRLRILRKYAPILNYHRQTTYRPTRYEAFVRHARLEEFGDPDDDTPTVFDLAGKRSGWELDLRGDTSDYPRYDDTFPRTVYGSVHENVRYEGGSYTAITYWLFYVYDPKHSGSLAALFAHQSDLETVTILVQNGEPRWIGASQHYGGEIKEWSKARTDGTHVKLYPAVGAHSSYLRNTQRYSGGIPVQEQFVSKESTDPTVVDSTTLSYVDVTGNDTRLTNTGDGESGYQLVPLTGNEVWATYNGSFGPDDDAGKAPFVRKRWTTPGQWMEAQLVTDERQVDGSVAISALSIDGDQIRPTVEILNEGPKPHTVWLTVEAKPRSADWGSGDVISLREKSTAVGFEESTFVDLASPLPESAGTWNVRVRLTAYSPSVADESDVLDSVVLDEPVDVGNDDENSSSGASPTTGRIELSGAASSARSSGSSVVSFNLTNVDETSLNGPALRIESVPEDWTITAREDAGATWKASERTWLWLSLAGNATKSPTVTLSVPETASTGTYYVNATALGPATSGTTNVTVEVSDRSPVSVVAGSDDRVSLTEVQSGIQRWSNGQTVGSTGETLSVTQVQQLIRAWARGTPVS